MRGRKCLDDVCAQAIEPFVIAQVGGELTFVAVKKNHIDVGTVIELASAEFSKSEHGEFRIRRTETVAQFPIPVPKNLRKTNGSELRKLLRGFLDTGDLCDFPQSDARHLATFPSSEYLKIILRDVSVI